ncbi:MAG: type II secretion system protein GspG [Phycisphaerales bacterium]
MGRFAANPHGWDQPTPRAPANGLGVAGFVVSLVGLFLCPFVALVGMVMSFIAMFREPRGFAIAGFVIGLVGSLLLLVLAVVFGVVFLIAGAAFAAHGLGGVDATFEMIEIGDRTEVHRRETGDLPASLDELSGLAPDELIDPWGNRYRYERSADGASFTLQSTGRDGQPDTNDDLLLNHAWLTESP